MNKFDFNVLPIRPYPFQLSERVDLRLTTPERNFGCAGKAREVNTIYEDIPHNNVVWQPDVYAEARAVADQNNIRRIIDVGCGNGEKLVHFFPAEHFQTVGLDFQGSLEIVSRTFPSRQWMECNLTSSEELSQVFDELDSDEPILLILSDVIEHLPDPRPLLARLRTVITRHEKNRLFLSTPDRAQLGYETDDSLPENDAHLREWTIDELAGFCEASGFQIVRCGHTRPNQFDERYSTIFAELRCDEEHYVRFLNAAGLLHGSVLPRQLLVTTEYAGLHNTGGIGTFVAEQRLTYGMGNTLCLFIGQEEGLDAQSFNRHQLIRVGALVDEVDLSLPLEDITLKATLQLLFYFPNIDKIEYADYQGLGCRLAQAKRAGLFSRWVQLIVHCHGATHYLENANQTWYGGSHFGVAEREKISIENADAVVFPTVFLRDLYREIGVEVAEEKIIELRYPYHAAPVEIGRTERADTLVFFGKRSAMKGYGLFLGALASEGATVLKGIGIKRIVFVGPRVTESLENVSHMEVLRAGFEVVEFTSLSRNAAMDQLRAYADSAICVMPYLGDNHPYALLDVTFVGVLPVMLRAGGVVELFPAPFDQALLADPTEAALLACLVALVKLPVQERHRLRVDFLSAMLASQAAINNAVHAFGEVKARPPLERPQGRATVIVPVFNTDLQYIRELVFGLNNQSMAPAEVIFVDDTSQPGYVGLLEDQLRRELRLPYRIIRHAANKGLAGARNSGLAATNTEYVINVDSDDVPLNDFVWDIVHRLEAEPQCAAAVPYLKAFDEEADFNQQAFGGYVYRPLGDGVVASQLDNHLGHANSGYRVSVMRALGGWDESEKSMWEDWALFLKLTSSGHRIGVIPKVGCLYRVRKQSMLRTYKVWPAMRRLARNMEGLPRFENFRLQAVMRYWRDEEGAMRSELARLRHEHSCIQAEQGRLSAELSRVSAEANTTSAELSRASAEVSMMSAELNRASVRAVRVIVARMVRFPRTFAAARAVGATVWRTARRVRNISVGK